MDHVDRFHLFFHHQQLVVVFASKILEEVEVVEEHCDHHTSSQIGPIYLAQTGRISLFPGHDHRDGGRDHGPVLYHVPDRVLYHVPDHVLDPVPGHDHGLFDLILFLVQHQRWTPYYDLLVWFVQIGALLLP